MANIFDTIPVYITLSNLRDSTTNPDLKDDWIVSDTNVQALISKAQNIIDDIISDYWVPNIENQETIFPVKNDDWSDNETIPLSIQKATLLLVENLYVWWALDWNAYEVWFNWKVKSETSRWHTVSYYNSAQNFNQFTNEEILMYLRPYLLNLSAQWYK